MYITTFDEIDFPAALSFLNLLLATHRHFCRVMGFEPNEPINSIAPGKPHHRSTFIVLTSPTDVSQRKGLNSSEKIVWDLRS